TAACVARYYPAGRIRFDTIALDTATEAKRPAVTLRHALRHRRVVHRRLRSVGHPAEPRPLYPPTHAHRLPDCRRTLIAREACRRRRKRALVAARDSPISGRMTLSTRLMLAMTALVVATATAVGLLGTHNV